MASRIIAIDGPAGSGKSTTAREVARRLGVPHLDTGALYRGATWAVLEAGDDLTADAVLAAVGARGVSLADVDGRFRVLIDGDDPGDRLRSPEVTAAVSTVAALPPIRAWATTVVRDAVARHPHGAVADGRDIGTVVFPDAVLKVFLTASIDERARRRAAEEGRAEAANHLADALRARDQADASREVSPLQAAPDALVIDTTDLSFEGQVELVLKRARSALR